MDDEQIIELFYLRREEAIAETERKHGTVCRMTAGKILDSHQDIEECFRSDYRYNHICYCH